MRRMDFSIENNGHLMSVGQKLKVKEYQTASYYSYMIEHSLGMSKPYTVSERLKTDTGTVLEIKKTERFNVAVLEFDE